MGDFSRPKERESAFREVSDEISSRSFFGKVIGYFSCTRGGITISDRALNALFLLVLRIVLLCC